MKDDFLDDWNEPIQRITTLSDVLAEMSLDNPTPAMIRARLAHVLLSVHTPLTIHLQDIRALSQKLPRGTHEQRVLLAWCDDESGVHFYALPRSLEPKALLDDLRCLNGCRISKAAHAEAQRFGAFVRVEALAMGSGEIVGHLLRDYRDEIERVRGGFAAADLLDPGLDAYIGKLCPWRMDSARDMTFEIVEVIGFNRAR